MHDQMVMMTVMIMKTVMVMMMMMMTMMMTMVMMLMMLWNPIFDQHDKERKACFENNLVVDSKRCFSCHAKMFNKSPVRG